MSKRIPGISPSVAQIRKKSYLLGVILTSIILVFTTIAIVIAVNDTPKGYKTDNNIPIIWCDSAVPVYLDDDISSIQFDLEDILDVYQPYTPNLLFMGIVPEGTRLPKSIQVHMMDMPDPDGDEWGAEVTQWDKNGCVLSSDIYLYPNIQGYDRYITLCHEFGHSMGLTHSQETWSVMYSPPGSIQCFLTKKEKKILMKLYGE